MNGRKRTFALSGVLALLALVVLPVASATKPVREVLGPSDLEPQFIPAGFGCEFDTLWTPQGSPGFAIVTSFSDGRVMTVGHGEPTLTNLDTGEVYVNASRYQVTEVYDEAANDLLGEGGGRIVFGFLPGDQGPFGEVGENGATYSLVGSFRLTFDLDTQLLTSFEFVGSATDICAILAA